MTTQLVRHCVKAIASQRTMPLALALICALALCGSAQSADFVRRPLFPNKENSPPALVLRGTIEPGDYNRILAYVIRERKIFESHTLVLASSGGDIKEALRLAELFKKTYKTIWVSDEHGQCASACFLIYVSAVERDAVGPALGIHRPYLSDVDMKRLSLRESEFKLRQLASEVRSYLAQADVPQDLIDKVFSLASTEIHWLTGSETDRLGLRAPWWEQTLIARCKLDRALEQRLLAGKLDPEGHKRALQHTGEVAECAFDISVKERTQYLNSLQRAR